MMGETIMAQPNRNNLPVFTTLREQAREDDWLHPFFDADDSDSCCLELKSDSDSETTSLYYNVRSPKSNTHSPQRDIASTSLRWAVLSAQPLTTLSAQSSFSKPDCSKIQPEYLII